MTVDTIDKPFKGIYANVASLPFVQKFYHMLESDQFNDVIKWCFCMNTVAFVFNKEEFCVNVMPIYFPTTKYESVIRELNMHEFKMKNKGKKNCGKVYFHQHFRPKCEDMLLLIERRDSYKTKKKAKKPTSKKTAGKFSAQFTSTPLPSLSTTVDILHNASYTSDPFAQMRPSVKSDCEVECKPIIDECKPIIDESIGTSHTVAPVTLPAADATYHDEVITICKTVFVVARVTLKTSAPIDRVPMSCVGPEYHADLARLKAIHAIPTLLHEGFVGYALEATETCVGPEECVTMSIPCTLPTPPSHYLATAEEPDTTSLHPTPYPSDRPDPLTLKRPFDSMQDITAHWGSVYAESLLLAPLLTEQESEVYLHHRDLILQELLLPDTTQAGEGSAVESFGDAFFDTLYRSIFPSEYAACAYTAYQYTASQCTDTQYTHTHIHTARNMMSGRVEGMQMMIGVREGEKEVEEQGGCSIPFKSISDDSYEPPRGEYSSFGSGLFGSMNSMIGMDND